MTTALICGDRNWTDRAYLFERMDEMRELWGIDEVIEGCARGADKLGEAWALDRGLHLWHFPADWTTWGKAAGTIRNRQMLLEGKPDLVIAFHTNLQASKGTADMVRRAKAAHVETFVFPHSHEGYEKPKRPPRPQIKAVEMPYFGRDQNGDEP